MSTSYTPQFFGVFQSARGPFVYDTFKAVKGDLLKTSRFKAFDNFYEAHYFAHAGKTPPPMRAGCIKIGLYGADDGLGRSASAVFFDDKSKYNYTEVFETDGERAADVTQAEYHALLETLKKLEREIYMDAVAMVELHTDSLDLWRVLLNWRRIPEWIATDAHNAYETYLSAIYIYMTRCTYRSRVNVIMNGVLVPAAKKLARALLQMPKDDATS